MQTNARAVCTDPAYDSPWCRAVPGATTAWPFAQGKDGRPHTSYPHGLVNVMNTTRTHRTLEPGESLDAELTFAMFDCAGHETVRRVGLDGSVVIE